MEKYIGIGFIILCLAVLVGIIGIVTYQLYIDKEKVDISSAKTNINQSNNSPTIEQGLSLALFILYVFRTFNIYLTN